jgi:hypothetical protein
MHHGDMPVLFIEPDALFFILEKTDFIHIRIKSPGNLSVHTGLPADRSDYDTLIQDGIEIGIEKSIQIPVSKQITISLYTGLLGRKLIAAVTPLIRGPGFQGTRY